jgi:hypothetical protein
LLISNASYHQVSPLVTPADFYEPLHGRLFEAIGALVAKNSPATPLTLMPFFEGEMIGPLTVLQYLGHFIAAATNVENAKHHAAAIADLKRRLAANLVRNATLRRALKPRSWARKQSSMPFWTAIRASTGLYSGRGRPDCHRADSRENQVPSSVVTMVA